MSDQTAAPARSLHRVLGALALVLGLSFFASCHTTDPRYNHWRFESMTPRAAYHFLSYNTDSGVPYYRHVSSQRSSINMTLRRHLMNDNPENPFQRKTVWIPPRKQFSPLPDPVHFFHLSSVAFGAALLGAGGAFILFPYEVVPVMFEDGGPSHMWDGIRSTFGGKSRRERGPAPAEEFRVKNR